MKKSKLMDCIDDCYEEHLKGGIADGRKPSDFDLRQLFLGTSVELEHDSDPMVAMEIAMDHIMEDGEYYDKLKKIEPDEEPTALDLPK